MPELYHITHVQNLPRILASKGLWCDAERLRQNFISTGIAHETLKQRRLRTQVPKAAGGNLADYVPFYFCNRSPMLYSIHTGFVQGYDGGQENVVYLVSRVETFANLDRRWCFTDGHAVEAITKFYDNLDDLGQIDWNVIRDWSWKNTDADPDRKRRKQAEFLVQKSVSWPMINGIGVISQQMASQVERILDESRTSHRPKIEIETKWYYQR